MSLSAEERRTVDEPEPPCSCGGIQTDYGLAHRGTCAIMEWHDLQIISNVRLERAVLIGERNTLAAENKALVEALRRRVIFSQASYRPGQPGMQCDHYTWRNSEPERHAADCLARVRE